MLSPLTRAPEAPGRDLAGGAQQLALEPPPTPNPWPCDLEFVGTQCLAFPICKIRTVLLPLIGLSGKSNELLSFTFFMIDLKAKGRHGRTP